MESRFKIGKILVLLFFLSSLSSYAEIPCIPKKPNQHPYYVYDETGVFSRDQIIALENKLALFDDSTSNQITVVLVNDLCGYEPSVYATELGQQWGVGQEKKDNGIVVLIKPTGGKGERKVFIAVGYGLEAVIPDATAKIIVENEMLPSFKQDDVYGGVINALNILMPLAKGEFNEATYRQNAERDQIISLLLFALLFFVPLILFKIIKARSYARLNHTDLWTAFWLTSMFRSSSGRGSWGGFSGGGSGGFGGGGFGGGGAGGDW